MSLWINLFWFTIQICIIPVVTTFYHRGEFTAEADWCLLNFVIYIACAYLTVEALRTKHTYVVTSNVRVDHSEGGANFFRCGYDPTTGMSLLALAIFGLYISPEKVSPDDIYVHTLFRALLIYDMGYTVFSTLAILCMFVMMHCCPGTVIMTTNRVMNASEYLPILDKEKNMVAHKYPHLDSIIDEKPLEEV